MIEHTNRTGIIREWFGLLVFLLMCFPTLAQADDSGFEGSYLSGQLSDDLLLEEILITATKRTKNLQYVPISVTALSSNILLSHGAEDIRSLAYLSPSVNFTTSQSAANTTSLRVRGVGTTGNNAGFESSVGIFIDGVYQPRPGMALGEFVDIEQIEILRGPQGTLFGRNTSAGAISIKSKAPNTFITEGFANLTFGSDALLNIQAAYNKPLSDTFALRVSGSWRDRDGTMSNSDPTLPDSNDRDRYLVRAQALWEPSDDFSLRVIADQAESDELCCDPVLVTSNTQGANPVKGTTVDPKRSLNDRITESTGRREKSDQYGVSLELNWHINEQVALTYLPAYRDSYAENSGDDDFTRDNVFSTPDNSPNLSEVESQTHELRIQGELFGQRLDWLLGVYHSDEDVSERSTRIAGNALAGGFINGSTASNHFEQNSKTYSIFTHNMFNITDALSVTLGLRYVDETKRGGLVLSQGTAALCPGPGSPATDALFCNALWTPADASPLYDLYPNEKFSDDALTYTTNISYAYSNKALVYLSVSEGFKSGGLNLDITGTGFNTPTFESEVVTSYELGLKSTTLQGRLTTNVALFHMDIDDFQVLTLEGLSFNVFNVKKAMSRGIELDSKLQLDKTLLLNASVVFTDAYFPNDCSTQARVIAQCGHDLPNAPEFVAVVGADWKIALANDLQLVLTPTARYESSSQPATATPSFKQGSSTIVDMRAALNSENKNWSIELWGKNLTDENTLTRAFDTLSELGDPSTSGSISSWVIDPRSYGVTLRANF